MQSGRLLLGGGSLHIAAASAVREAAEAATGRQRLAMEAYARALEAVPGALIENAGANRLDVLLDLRVRNCIAQALDLGVAQKVVPVMSGTWDRQLELSQLQPSEAVFAHLNRATHLRLGLVRLHHDLLVLPTEVRVGCGGWWAQEPCQLLIKQFAKQVVLF